MNPSLIAALAVAALGSWLLPSSGFAQESQPPTLRVGVLPESFAIDGVLNEPAWDMAELTDAFRQTDPTEGAAPNGRTVVRVLADPKAVVIGIVCEDPEPARIVSFSVRRDAVLDSEDHVRVVLGPFLDGRSGYVFALNPSGATLSRSWPFGPPRCRPSPDSPTRRRGCSEAHGFQLGYPNDLWDIALTYKRIGRNFDPSLGFVPRRAVHLLQPASQQPHAVVARTPPAATSRVRAVRGHRSVEPMGELPHHDGAH